MKTLPSGRVAVIGAGMVGSSVAYAILNHGIASELLIIDIAENLAKAHVLDLQDASAFTSGTKVKFAGYEDLQDGDIVVVTSGAAQKEGQTRTDLLAVNVEITRSVIKGIRDTGKQLFVVMVANPVDVLTYIAVTESGLPASMVFGSGTYLDSGRLRNVLAEELAVGQGEVSAFILGEHGDSSFPVISSANVSGISLATLMTVDDALYARLMEKVRSKAYEIIAGKKATYFGIGSAIAVITRAIIRDEDKVLPLSVKLTGEYGYNDVCISVPARLNAHGYQLIGEVSLSAKERELFDKSVATVTDNLKLI